MIDLFRGRPVATVVICVSCGLRCDRCTKANEHFLAATDFASDNLIDLSEVA